MTRFLRIYGIKFKNLMFCAVTDMYGRKILINVDSKIPCFKQYINRSSVMGIVKGEKVIVVVETFPANW